MTCDLYLLTASDGLLYIGVAKNARRRLAEHRRKWAGKDATLRILVRGERDYIFGLEPQAIIVFETRWPRGHNLDAGGYGAHDHLPQTRKKMADAKFGKSLRPEHRAKVVAILKQAQALATERARLAPNPRRNKFKPGNYYGKNTKTNESHRLTVLDP